MVPPGVRQTWVVSAVLINMVGQGMLLSYTSSLLPALKDPESPIFTDINTASWVSSCIGIAGLPGFICSSILMDLFGRKITHILVILPGLTGWLLIAFANTIPPIMVGRVLTGFTAGATVSLGAIAIGEYSNPIYRGSFLNLKTTSVCLGGMLTHILSNYLQWRTVAMVSVVPYIVAVLITTSWPESPSWYAGRRDFVKCEEAFFWLRGKTEDSIKELDELIQARMAISEKPIDKTWKEKIIDLGKKFTRRDLILPLVISVTGTLLLESSGRHFFPAYAPLIMGEMTGSKGDSFYYTLGIDLIVVLSTSFSSVLVRLAKRRTLLFSTGFASYVVLMVVCSYLYLQFKEIIPNDYNFIPMGLFVLYFVLVNLGCTPIPLAFLGEIFPLEHRGIASAMSGISISLSLMFAFQLMPILMDKVKVHGTFGVFGTIQLITLIILFYTLPETKDKTLQEIEDHFNGKTFKKEDEEVTEKMMP